MFPGGSPVEIVLMFLVLTNLYLLAASRLATFIQISAAQGLILGVLTLALHRGELTTRVILLAIGSAALKGVLFPALLYRTMRVVNIKREIEPLVGYSASIVLGMGFFAFSSWLASRLPFAAHPVSAMVLPITLFMIFTGCFLIVARSKAIIQVIGYLLMENGIYLLGVGTIGETPLLVELGVLLDVTVGIFVMQILVHHIGKEFESLSVNKLSQLKDWGAS